jgi:hypothetical protein
MEEKEKRKQGNEASCSKECQNRHSLVQASLNLPTAIIQHPTATSTNINGK